MQNEIPVQLLIGALALPLGSLWFFFRQVKEQTAPREVILAALPFGASVALALWVVVGVLSPGEPLAGGALTVGGPPLVVAPHDGSVSLLVHGAVPDGRDGQAHTGSYELAVRSEGQTVAELSGQLSSRTEERRVGRSGRGKVLVNHLEERQDLPPAAQGHPLEVYLTHEGGELHGALKVSAIPSPPAQATVAALGGALTLAAALVDRRSSRSMFTLLVGTVACYAVLVCKQVTAGGGGNPVIGAIIMALVVGLLGGQALRWVVRRALGGAAAEPTPAAG